MRVVPNDHKGVHRHIPHCLMCIGCYRGGVTVPGVRGERCNDQSPKDWQLNLPQVVPDFAAQLKRVRRLAFP
jgi:hypothetical protein